MHHKVKKGLSIYAWSCLVIILGFLAVAISNWSGVSQIVNDDLEKSTRLMTANLYTAIQNELGKPTVVANTMASDTYLVQWLREERSGNRTYIHQEEMRKYLANMKSENNYSSVYMVSEETRDYYCHEGKNRTLDRGAEDDEWYFNFIESGKHVDLRVDEDELNNNRLSVFINARIENKEADDELMGVIGISLPIELFQKLFEDYEKEYGIKVCLVNDKGIIEVKPEVDTRKRISIYNKWKLESEAIEVLEKREGNNIWTYFVDGTEYCVVSHYIEELDWYLYIQEISSNSVILNHLTNRSFGIMAMVLIILLGVNVWLIYYDNKRKEKRMTIDPLTGAANRNYFFDIILPKVNLYEDRQRYVIIFDIDCFKKVNDTRGHNAGDELLKKVAESGKKRLKPYGEVVRWGGDEFITLAAASRKQIEEIFAGIQQDVSEEGITISMGAARYETNRDILQIIDRADQAMYQQKRNGRNGLTFYEH